MPRVCLLHSSCLHIPFNLLFLGSGHAPLAGAIVCCTSLDISERDQIHEQATTLGATKCTFDLTMDVTHLVVGATTSPKYKFVARNSPDVHVVLPDFIKAMRLAWMAGEEVDLDKLHNDYKAPALLGLRISLTGFTDRKKIIT
jgi:DNA replication regulator DPB11